MSPIADAKSMKWAEAQIPHPNRPSDPKPAASRRVNRQRLWWRPQASLKSGQPERGRSPRTTPRTNPKQLVPQRRSQIHAPKEMSALVVASRSSLRNGLRRVGQLSAWRQVRR